MNRRCLTLESLGLHNGSRILFETKREDHSWPIDRVAESTDFRTFAIGHRVDAQDHTGKWFKGQVS